jgi:hypothetical protein
MISRGILVLILSVIAVVISGGILISFAVTITHGALSNSTFYATISVPQDEYSE